MKKVKISKMPDIGPKWATDNFYKKFHLLETLELQIKLTKATIKSYIENNPDGMFNDFISYLENLDLILKERYEKRLADQEKLKQADKIKKFNVDFKYSTMDSPEEFLKELKNVRFPVKIENMDEVIKDNIRLLELRQRLSVESGRNSSREIIKRIKNEMATLKYIFSYEDKRKDTKMVSFGDLEQRQISIIGLKTIERYDENCICVKVAVFDFNNSFKHRAIIDKIQFLKKFIFELFGYMAQMEISVFVCYKEKEHYLKKNAKKIINKAFDDRHDREFYRSNNLINIINLGLLDAKGGIVSNTKL